MRTFLRDERGVAAIMTAMFASIFMAMAALAVDYGNINLQSRKLQGMADLAAMAAASDLPHAKAAAERVVAISDWDRPVSVTVTTGRYTASQALQSRFEAGATPANAVQVQLHSDTQLYFGAVISGHQTADVARQATAAQAQLAAFSLGSRLVGLNGGVANAVLSALTGGHVTLSVMDYNAIASADIDVLSYLGDLKAEIGSSDESYSDFLQTRIDGQDALTVLADHLKTAGLRDASSAVRAIAGQSNGVPSIALGDLIDLGAYTEQDRSSESAKIKVSAMDMVNAILTLGAADHQMKLDLGASVPGLAQTSVWLAVGERMEHSPWMAVTAEGTPILHTAQTRLLISTNLAIVAGALKTAGIASLQVPVVVELASAEAKLSAIGCGTPSSANWVDLLVKPSIGHLAIAAVDPKTLNDFTTPLVEQQATLASVLVVSVKGQARVDLGGTSYQKVRFLQKDIDTNTIKSVDTTDITQATLSSLLTGLTLTVNVAGLGLTVGGIDGAVRAALTSAAAPVDGLINNLTATLGLHLGQADVRVDGLRCHAPALVQ